MNKARFVILFTALVICIFAIIIIHGRLSSTDSVAAAPSQKASADGVWLPVEAAEFQSRKRPEVMGDVPDSARTLRLEPDALTRVLNTATRETGDSLSFSRTVLSLPLPSGEFVDFRIEESPVLDAQLTERYPNIKSYRGVAVADGSITMRADWTPQGFHALILTPDHTYSVVPTSPLTSQATVAEYAAFDAGAAQAVTEADFQCLVQETKASQENPPVFGRLASVGASRRNYRMAISTSWEYCNAYGRLSGGTIGTVQGTTASLNTWLNSINAIYERDLNIHFNLVNAPNVLYCTENGYAAATDPYTNGNAGSMLSQIRPVLRDQVGQTSFDIGHVFGYVPPGTGAGGVAWLGVVCDNGNANGDSLGPIKGGGVSVLSGSIGNASFVNVIVHEMGHQFGAAHSFNGTTGNCGGGNRSAASGVETGSGSTIMSYAGNCGSDNVATGSTLRFHAWSFAQIINYTTSGTGNGCATNSSTGNAAPTVNGGSDYTIPRQTPFELAAVGNDADAADTLAYGWEQIDAGNSFSNPPYTDAGDAANSTRPLFRSYGSSSSPSRTFPALTYILNNANTPPATYVSGSSTLQTADFLSNINRSLRFRVVARDGRGGATDDEVLLTVNAAAGPFLVTAPNTAVTWGSGSTQTVTWSVNNTNAAPINCANVRILLSTDGGQTFPTVLAATTANDGSEAVTLPSGVTSTTARIKVQSLGNVFFDISDANFTLANLNNYEGYFSQLDCQTISGWAADRNRLNTAINISVYDGATLVTTVLANQSRPDVATYLGDNGLHGFSFATPASLKDGTAHSISLRFESGTTALTLSPKTVTCSTAVYEGYVGRADCGFIDGWVADRSRLNTAINVSLYDGNTLLTTVLANQSRPDVATYLGDNGLHGFNISTPAGLKDGAAHTLNVRFESSTSPLGNTPRTINCGTPVYEGYVDRADCNVISGWVADRNRLNTAITVSLYDGSTLLTTITANQSRADVGGHLGDNGLHGFSVATPAVLKDGSAHTLNVRFETSATALGSSPRTVNCSNPIYEGYVDVANCNVISGWVVDRNRLNTAINVSVYDGTTLLITVTANQLRSDVGGYLGDNGLHGFSVATPAALKNGATQNVMVKFEASTTNLSNSPRSLTCGAALTQNIASSSATVTPRKAK